MKKKKKQANKNLRVYDPEEYKRIVNKTRHGSRLWHTMLKTGRPFTEVDNDYTKMQTLFNLAYILADVQDSCFMDANDVMVKYEFKVDAKTKHNFKDLFRAISQVNYQLKLLSDKVKASNESQNFVCGMSDILYDSCRMLFDRLYNKRAVISYISQLRKMPNYNQFFPELDKGRYVFNN